MGVVGVVGSVVGSVVGGIVGVGVVVLFLEMEAV